MTANLSRCVLLSLCVLVFWIVGATGMAQATDQVPVPPAREDFASPSGAFLFRLEAPPDFQTGRSFGLLHAVEDGVARLLWRREMPHAWRARRVLVSDSGRVLLLDDWFNTRNRYAVVVMSPDGALVASHAFDALPEALEAPVPAIVRAAQQGIWIGGHPEIAPDGEVALVPAAGKHLAIDLRDGSLSAQP